MQKSYMPEKLPLLRMVTPHPSTVRNAEGMQGNVLPSVVCYLIIIIWGFKYGPQPPSVLYKINTKKKQSHPRSVYNLCIRHLSCRERMLFWKATSVP